MNVELLSNTQKHSVVASMFAAKENKQEKGLLERHLKNYKLVVRLKHLY